MGGGREGRGRKEDVELETDLMKADELVITIPGDVKLLLPSPSESSSCSTSGCAIPSSEAISTSGWCRIEEEEVEGSSGEDESYIDSVGVVNLNMPRAKAVIGVLEMG